MKRSEFIKNLILLFGATVLPSSLQAMVRAYRRIYLLQSFVRGFAYYNGPLLLKKMKVGALLELVREPENEFDNFAIAIYYQGKKIGFVPAESNEILAKILDANLLKLQAEITHVSTKAQSWENTAVAIYVLQETNEPLPANAKYLLNLEDPHYRSLNSTNYFVEYDEELFDDEFLPQSTSTETKGEKLYNMLEANSKTDSIYDDIHENFTEKEFEAIAAQNRVVINRKNLPKKVSVKKIAETLDKKIMELNGFFADDGYVMVNLDKLDKLPVKIQNVQSILDKSSNQFMEIIVA